MNNDKIATITIAPTSLTDNYLWIPEGITDNVVPGLNSLLTYPQSKYATINALQNAMNNITNTFNDEISNIQTEIDNIETNSQQNANKNLSYHTNHTNFMYHGNTTKNDNRRSFIIQQNFFTDQRKGNQELQIQALSITVSDLQTQITNITSNNPPDNNDPDVGTMYIKIRKCTYYLFHIYIYTNMWM